MTEAAMNIVRAALRIGVLQHHPKCWRFGRRQFAFKTVARLIERGEAVRDGDTVRAR